MSGTGGFSSGRSIVVIGGGGSMPAPEGRLKCQNAEGTIGFDCTLYDLECCDLKDVCYDPDTEAEFCERPYCD